MASNDDRNERFVGLRRATEIYHKHGPYIRNIIELHARNKADADDRYQEFFLVLAKTKLPNRIRNLRKYLYRMIVNNATSLVRSHNCYLYHIHNYAETHKCREHHDDPSKVVAKNEEIQKVFSKIEKSLPRREAQVVMCRYQDECDTGEAAEQLGIRPRSVARYLTAGLRRMRQNGLLKEGAKS